MATVDGSPVSSAKLTELGKALDQTSISRSGRGSTVSRAVPEGDLPSDAADEMDEDSDVAPATLPTKSPKKRGRTDSLKKMLPAPASQRHKQVRNTLMDSPHSPLQGSSDTEEDAAGSPTRSALPDDGPPPPLSRSQSQPAKLMVKDRRGSGMGVPRAHLILNAVKQAPPAKEKSNPRRWSKHEDESLRLAVERSGERNWKAIADQVPGRNHTQCLQRWTKVLKPGLIKGHWTPEEDAKLRELVAEGKKNWGQVASLIPGRTSKQCRERWCNHLDPNINKGSYTEDEDKIIVEMQAKLGNRWSIIAQQLKGRTEDAVKIRWKSLMRGRRAASKEDKQPSSGTTSSASSITTSSAPLTTDIEQQKVKFSKASPARVNTQTAAPEASSVSGLKNEMVRTKKGAVDATSTSKSMSYMPDTVFVKSSQALAPASRPDLVTAMNGSNPMHMNDLVAASIHNFQMSQRFRSSSSSHTSTTMYPGNPNQVILPVNQQHSAIYAMPDGAMGTYNMNTLPLMQQHQQLPPSFQYSPGFTMPQNMGGMPNYVVPTNFAASNLMQMPMQLSMAMPPLPSTPSFSSQTMALAMPNAPYQQQSATLHSGFSGAPLHPRGSPQPTIHQTSNGFAASSNSSTTGGVNGSGTSPASLPPSSAAAASGGGKGLNTPREEWGSSQTPRSRMIMTEGHASAYELFHQQRLRLMLQERDKQGLSLSSAPSPGQALLTKELEANKERQARQAIMQKGWKSAVDSMSFSSVSDLSTLDEQQRFDGLLEKVSLSALDPTDDELLEQSVDIISGDETVDL